MGYCPEAGGSLGGLGCLHAAAAAKEQTMNQHREDGPSNDRDLVVEPGAAILRLAGLEGPARASDARGTQRHAASERFDVIVIGGGQAGLSVGYHLKLR